MTLKRHKQFKKDFTNLKLIDKQFEKFLRYISILLNDKKLPKEHEITL